ncbi:MAG: DUF1460 domain-containing protein [Ignavibacteria bacterium]|nr:DUF1460 domain-containing protein [Ignavibacteria bacterium]
MNLLNRHSLISAIVLISISLLSLKITAEPADDYEEMKCRKKLKSFDASLKDLPLNEVIAEVGKSFTGTPYVAGTLDEYPNTEELVINITGLDCVTFVENALIFSRLIKSGNADFDNYKKELELIRYRNGKNSGYSSRLHYFIDWIYDNQKKGIVKDITSDIGGVNIGKNIDFMTSHRNSYKQLQNNDILLGEMHEVENSINSREIFYIPVEDISSVYDKLRTGDIVGITTSIGGLDISHTGFIYKEGGGTYLMHASLKNKKVEISSSELQDYIFGNSKQTGIVVARVLE